MAGRGGGGAGLPGAGGGAGEAGEWSVDDWAELEAELSKRPDGAAPGAEAPAGLSQGGGVAEPEGAGGASIRFFAPVPGRGGAWHGWHII